MSKRPKLNSNEDCQSVVLTTVSGRKLYFMGRYQVSNAMINREDMRIVEVVFSKPIPLKNGEKWETMKDEITG